MDDLLADAADRARRYVRDVAARPVGPTPAALAGLDHFDEPLPEHPSAPEETLALLDAHGSPATVASTGPRYFGFVIGGGPPTAPAAPRVGAGAGPNAAVP